MRIRHGVRSLVQRYKIFFLVSISIDKPYYLTMIIDYTKQLRYLMFLYVSKSGHGCTILEIVPLDR